MLVNRLERLRGGTLFQTYMLCSVLRSVNTNVNFNTNVNDEMLVLGMVSCMSYVCQSQYQKTFGHFLLIKNSLVTEVKTIIVSP